jgi:magnesium-transporting ATPase (P-type)
MKRFHLIFGVTVVIVFLLTGQYMDRYLNHLEGMADGPRMLYRTRHIFILLAGLLNLGLSAYFSFRTTQAGRVMQMIGSTLIVLATALFVVAFIYEPKMNALETPFSHRAMYSIFAGTLLHVLSGIAGRQTKV